MKISKAYCFFEQSGTFKNQFKALGVDAEDYDILNDFGETDYVMDLFREIDNAYSGKTSIFDKVKGDEIILAFFPCVRFEAEILLHFRGQCYGERHWDLTRRMEYCMQLHQELNRMYELINKLFIVCIKKGLRLIVENPYSEEHYLRRYWCMPPAVIDHDRRRGGDYFKKPTQYWFINCEPENNVLWEPPYDSAISPKGHEGDAIRFMTQKDYAHTNAKNAKAARSMIHPDYANRFIRTHLLDE